VRKTKKKDIFKLPKREKIKFKEQPITAKNKKNTPGK
jgi:hypothetical protein